MNFPTTGREAGSKRKENGLQMLVRGGDAAENGGRPHGRVVVPEVHQRQVVEHLAITGDARVVPVWRVRDGRHSGGHEDWQIMPYAHGRSLGRGYVDTIAALHDCERADTAYGRRGQADGTAPPSIRPPFSWRPIHGKPGVRQDPEERRASHVRAGCGRSVVPQGRVAGAAFDPAPAGGRRGFSFRILDRDPPLAAKASNPSGAATTFDATPRLAWRSEDRGIWQLEKWR